MLNITQIPTFYINLDDRIDRKKEMDKLLKHYGFTNFQRFSATKAGSRVGCSISHSELLKEIVTNNIYPVLVLEDDLAVYGNFTPVIDHPEHFDAMYLGISKYGYNTDKNDPNPRSLKISELGENYHRMHNMLARHAIIRNSSEYDLESIEKMEMFINNPIKYVAGDATLSSIHSKYKVYAQNVPTFFQNAKGVADLTRKTIYDCSYLEIDKQ